MSVLIPNGYETIDFNGLPFVVEPGYEARARSVWASAMPLRTEYDAKVRRVLDLGAGCGEFAVRARTLWTNCWIDCAENDDAMRRALYQNLPPGGKVVPGEMGDAFNFAAYQVIRIGSRWHLERIGASVLASVPFLIVDVREWRS